MIEILKVNALCVTRYLCVLINCVHFSLSSSESGVGKKMAEESHEVAAFLVLAPLGEFG